MPKRSETSVLVRGLIVLSSAATAAVIGGLLLPRWLTSEAPDGGVKSIAVGEDVEQLFEERAAAFEAPTKDGEKDGDEGRRLLRERLDEALVSKLFPIVDEPQFVYHPLRTFMRTPNYSERINWPEHEKGGWQNKTNAYGMRADADPGEPAPRWRVIVTGDSHTEGACANDESFPYLIGQSLIAQGHDAEVWNAGCGVYSFYEYLGALEHLLELDPDVFIVTVYGGNDFSGAMRLQRYFNGRPAPKRAWRLVQPYTDGGGKTPHDVFHQDLGQVVYFRQNPEDLEVAVETGIAVLSEMQAICDREGVKFAVAYLPPASAAQPKRFANLYAHAVETFEFTLEEVFRSNELADQLLAGLERRGVRCLDLRPRFSAAEETLYWLRDMHINLAGHRLVAELMEPLVLELLGD